MEHDFGPYASSVAVEYALKYGPHRFRRLADFFHQFRIEHYKARDVEEGASSQPARSRRVRWTQRRYHQVLRSPPASDSREIGVAWLRWEILECADLAGSPLSG